MAYSTSYPPLLTNTQPIASQRQWLYVSSHDRTVVVSSTHITNGKDLGMKVGDLVQVGLSTAADANSATDISVVSQHFVRTVASTYVVLSAGLMISSAS